MTGKALEVITLAELVDWWGLSSKKSYLLRLIKASMDYPDPDMVLRKSGKLYLIDLEFARKTLGDPKNQRPEYEL